MVAPALAWGVLFTLAASYEGWALIAHPDKPWTLSDGIWGLTRALAKHFPYLLTLLGILIGVFLGHWFYCPCEIS